MRERYQGQKEADAAARAVPGGTSAPSAPDPDPTLASVPNRSESAVRGARQAAPAQQWRQQEDGGGDAGREPAGNSAVPPSKRRKLGESGATSSRISPEEASSAAAEVIAASALKVAALSKLFSQDRSLSDFGLEQHLLRNMSENMKLQKPTQVQSETWSQVLHQRRDAMIKAPTGSGKTLAYLVPIVQALITADPKIERSSGTRAMVIAPSRELSLQIYDVLRKLLQPFPNVVPGTIMGGEKRKSEKARLRKGITILVSTPGRLLDHLKNTDSFQLPQLNWLVFDEADRLLDMGFEPDVRQILQVVASKKPQAKRELTTMLCSATLNEQVGRLVDLTLKEPLFISVSAAAVPPLVAEMDSATNNPSKMEGDGDADDDASMEDDLEVVPREADDDDMDVEGDADHLPMSAGKDAADEELERAHAIPPQLKQHFTVCHAKRKLVTLAAFLRWKLQSDKNAKIIVFLSNCDSVEFLYALFSTVELPKANALKRRRQQVEDDEDDSEPLLPCNLFKLHGNLSQQVRSSTFATFGKAERGVMFATDVVARGVDLPHVSWIVQYDVPADPAAYVHRIGRTARIGSSGDALLMIVESELPYVAILRARKLMAIQELASDKILSHLKTNLERPDRTDPARECSSLQHLMEQIVSASARTDFKMMAVRAYQSFLRSYATHSKATKHIFHIKNIHLGHLARNFALTDPPSKFKAMLEAAAPAVSKKHGDKGRNLKVYRTDSPSQSLPGIGSFAAKYLGKGAVKSKTGHGFRRMSTDASAEFAAGI